VRTRTGRKDAWQKVAGNAEGETSEEKAINGRCPYYSRFYKLFGSEKDYRTKRVNKRIPCGSLEIGDKASPASAFYN